VTAAHLERNRLGGRDLLVVLGSQGAGGGDVPLRQGHASPIVEIGPLRGGLHLGGDVGLLDLLDPSGEPCRRSCRVPGLQKDVSCEVLIPVEPRAVAVGSRQLRHLGDILESLRGGALVDEGLRRPEQRQPTLAVAARHRRQSRIGGPRLGPVALEHLVVADPDVGVHEVAIKGEGLLVILHGVVEPAHLHQQLRVRIVGVGVLGDQLDVPPEGLLGIGEPSQEAVGVTELVVGLGERRIDDGGLFILRDGRRVVLLSEVEVAQEHVDALVLGTKLQQLRIALLLPRDIASRARIEPEDHEALRLRDPVGQGDGLLQGLEELLGGAGVDGQVEVGARETGVLDDRLPIELSRVSRPKGFGHVPTLQVQRAGVLRRRRDRDLPGLDLGSRPEPHRRQAAHCQPHEWRQSPKFNKMHELPPCPGQRVQRSDSRAKGIEGLGAYGRRMLAEGRRAASMAAASASMPPRTASERTPPKPSTSPFVALLPPE
jgi:hypothetical protein